MSFFVHFILDTQITGILLFPTPKPLMEAAPAQLSWLCRAEHALVLAAQRVAARNSIRLCVRRVTEVERTLQLVGVLWWYTCGMVSEVQVHVVLCTK